jgi:hypothetical protein
MRHVEHSHGAKLATEAVRSWVFGVLARLSMVEN